jgi:hypothetical protein
MRPAILLLLLLAAQLVGCTSVVIIQRSVPVLADQWRAAATAFDGRPPTKSRSQTN